MYFLLKILNNTLYDVMFFGSVDVIFDVRWSECQQ